MSARVLLSGQRKSLMQNLWTWSGKYFGHRDGDDLWAFHGKHVGRFHDEDVYGRDGRYLGEIMNDRLITNKAMAGLKKAPFAPYGSRVGSVGYAAYVGYVMYSGYEDFPGPDQF
jgi:hypothetical protein